MARLLKILQNLPDAKSIDYNKQNVQNQNHYLGMINVTKNLKGIKV